MKLGPAGLFGAQLRALREAAGFTQEELATIAGLSVCRIERRASIPHVAITHAPDICDSPMEYATPL